MMIHRINKSLFIESCLIDVAFIYIECYSIVCIQSIEKWFATDFTEICGLMFGLWDLVEGLSQDTYVLLCQICGFVWIYLDVYILGRFLSILITLDKLIEPFIDLLFISSLFLEGIFNTFFHFFPTILVVDEFIYSCPNLTCNRIK